MANIDKKEENKQLKKQLKQAQRKIERLLSENESLKAKNKILSTETAEIDSLITNREGTGNHGATIPRYRHGEIAVRYAVMLYAYAGISSHQVPKAMQLAGLLWNGITDSIPSHVTVLEWVEKCGLSLTKGCMKKKTAEEAYSIIFDNSITICGQDLHLQLRTSSRHPGHSLRQTDVNVVRMKSGKNWDAEKIRMQLEQTIKEEGHNPEYVVSDNGNIMCKAASELGLKHHKDISHSFGIFLENVYSKDPDFCSFIAKKGYARKFSHTPMACLMPPKRREFARFMNVFETVHWAKAVIENEHLLSSREKYMLGFVKTHASLVEELNDVMAGYEYMEQLCKDEGLSHKTARMCRDYVARNFMTKGDRMRMLGDMIISYFNREETLQEDDEPHNICSDIIESTFGYFKDRMSPNKNNGYTPLVLLIPLRLQLSTIEDCKKFNARTTIGKTKMEDIKKWRADNLLPNPSIKRMNVLKKVS